MSLLRPGGYHNVAGARWQKRLNGLKTKFYLLCEGDSNQGLSNWMLMPMQCRFASYCVAVIELLDKLTLQNHRVYSTFLESAMISLL